MPDTPSFDDLISLAGTPSFFPGILSYAQNSMPGTLPLDPIIFQAILLCMIAGDKHLILLVPEEDIGLVARLAVWTLSSIFGLPTHRVRFKPKSLHLARLSDDTAGNDSFLRSLLLNTSHDEINTSGRPRSTSSREGSYPRPHTRPAKFKSPPHSRSTSFPNEISSARATPSILSNPFTDQESSTNLDQRKRDATKPPRPIHHVHTEPTPLRQLPGYLEFPHALVLSGLEHTSVMEQKALAQVFSEKRIVVDGEAINPRHDQGRKGISSNADMPQGNPVLDDTDYYGTWDAPEEFIAVYVCRWDAHERPAIHKSLLDRFAMSSTVLIRQSIRQALRALPFTLRPSSSHLHSLAVSHSNPNTPSAFGITPLPQVQTPPFLTHPLPSPHSYTRRLPQVAHSIYVVRQVITRDLLQSLRLIRHRVYIAPTLSLYLTDLFSAARHHPHLEGRLLTARAMNDAKDLACAGRVIGIDPTGSELLRQSGLDELLSDNEDNDQDEFHEYEEINHHVGSGSALIDVSQEPVYFDIGGDRSQISMDPPVQVKSLDLSEADIARIVPRVITHRVRVRESPFEEVLGSAVFGATFGDVGLPSGSGSKVDYDDWETRDTIKDILVSILAEV